MTNERLDILLADVAIVREGLEKGVGDGKAQLEILTTIVEEILVDLKRSRAPVNPPRPYDLGWSKNVMKR